MLIVAQPVPPFTIGSIPVTLAVRSTRAVETTPAVALRKPVRLLRVKELEATKLEVEAVPVTAKFVVVAFVVVELVYSRFVPKIVLIIELVAVNKVAKNEVEVALPATSEDE